MSPGRYTEDDMRRIEERFADAAARVPMDEPLLEGMVKRAKTEGLRRIVARHDSGGLHDLAVAELARRESEDEDHEDPTDKMTAGEMPREAEWKAWQSRSPQDEDHERKELDESVEPDQGDCESADNEPKAAEPRGGIRTPTQERPGRVASQALAPQDKDHEAARRAAHEAASDYVDAAGGEEVDSGHVVDVALDAYQARVSAPESVIRIPSEPDGYCPVCGGESDHHPNCEVGRLEAEVARLSAPGNER